MKKRIYFLLFFLLTGAKTFATEWTSYVCYHTDTIHSSMGDIEYLRPVAYEECLSFHIENRAYTLLEELAAFNPALDCEEVKFPQEDGSSNISVYLKVKKLSDAGRNELIATLLIHGFRSVTIHLKDEEDSYGATYTLKDIDMPFFLPVYFEDQLSTNGAFIETAWQMLRIAYEKDIRNDYSANIFTHTVAAGETIYGISKQYGLTENELISINDLNDNPLQIGQKLVIRQSRNREIANSKTSGNRNGWHIVLYMLFGASLLLNVVLFWALKRPHSA
jgi:hypothetical protein